MAPLRQTSKQAKAAFKARNGSMVTRAEIRRLERGLQLQRRAEAARDRDARKKTLEAQKRVKPAGAALGQARKPLGTQRTVDRFGYKSSQLHLLNFVRKGKEAVDVDPDVVVEEGYGNAASGARRATDDFEAFDRTTSRGSPSNSAKNHSSNPSIVMESPSDLLHDADTDLEAMFASETQIQRELATCDIRANVDPDDETDRDETPVKLFPGVENRVRISSGIEPSFPSFTSEDWVLDSDDVEELYPASATLQMAAPNGPRPERGLETASAATDWNIERSERQGVRIIAEAARSSGSRTLGAVAGDRARADSIRMPPPTMKTIRHGTRAPTISMEDRESGSDTARVGRPCPAIQAHGWTKNPTVSTRPGRNASIPTMAPDPLSGSADREESGQSRQHSQRSPVPAQIGVSMADLEDLASMECFLSQSPGSGRHGD